MRFSASNRDVPRSGKWDDEASFHDHRPPARSLRPCLCRPASDQRELTQLVKDLNAALVKRDIAFLQRVVHKDYTHYRPRGTVENRAQYLKNRETGRVEFESLVVDDIKVRRYGDTAVVTYRSTAKGKDQKGVIDEQRRWTRVFVWQEGRWQLVHSQGTTIQKP